MDFPEGSNMKAPKGIQIFPLEHFSPAIAFLVKSNQVDPMLGRAK